MMTGNEIERDWRERGFGCAERTGEPGEVWHDLLYDADALFMVIEGGMEIDIAGLARQPESGEEILIPAETVHVVRIVGDIPARWLQGLRQM